MVYFMKSVLFVFSATGNCLTTARKLAPYLDNCQIISVNSLTKERKIIVTADTVGFVFPVYYGNMPYPVREAVSKMVFQGNPYIFAFNTCRGHVGAAPQRLEQLLRTRGQMLSYATGIKMPGNSFLNSSEVDQEYLDAQDQNIAEAVMPILERSTQPLASHELLPLTPVDYPNNFRGITTEDTCIGCGTCTTVCPMDNITMADGKALIGDDCATCLACFHWCPTESIYMSQQEEISRRRKYHHPDIHLSDIAHKN